MLGKPARPDEELWREEEALIDEANKANDHPDGEYEFKALGSDAVFDRVLFDGGEFGLQAAPGSAEEEEYLGIPGLLEPEQVSEVLRRRQARQLAAETRRRRKATTETTGEQPLLAADRPVVTHQQLLTLRRELNGLVGAWHHRTNRPHGAIHSDLRKICGGPRAPQATAAELQKRIDTIRRWATQA